MQSRETLYEIELELHSRRVPSQFTNQFHLAVAVRFAIRAENIVMPRVWFANDRHLPRVPRMLGLRFAIDQAPAIGGDVFFFQDRQNRLERAAVAAGHEFCAEEWPLVFAKLMNAVQHSVGLAVIVEGDDVAQFEGGLMDLVECLAFVPSR